MADWILHLHPVLQALLRAVLWVAPVFVFMAITIWLERRLLSWIQDRIGPNRVGNITFSRTSKLVPGFLKGKKFKLRGLGQPVADFVKMTIKEDITPAHVDRLLYFVAPMCSIMPALALGATVPWGPWTFLTPVADPSIGVLYIMAMSSLGVYGLVLGGYSSNNKYSLLGGLRGSAQLISYELAMGLAFAAIVMSSGSLRVSEILRLEQGPLWGGLTPIANWNILTPYGFVAGIVFFICAIAETNRAPFDLPEAENELVAGYHTEYSSLKFGMFFMSELVGIFVWGGIFSTLFLGGYHLLPIRFDEIGGGTGIWHVLDMLNGVWLAPLWFLLKVYAVISVFIWIRATLPRLRYDQLMSLGWKSLLPLAVSNLMIVSIWILAVRLYNWEIGLGAAIAAGFIAWLLYRAINRTYGDADKKLEDRQIRMVQMKPGPEGGAAPEPVSVS